jgi:hypothetical protein
VSRLLSSPPIARRVDTIAARDDLLIWVAPAAVFVATVLLYLPSFGAWFAVLDFNHLDAIRTTDAGTYFRRIFDPSDGGRTLFNTGELYRPTYYSAFWLEFQVFGFHPTAYYIFNACLHATNAVLVWALAWRLSRSLLAATAGAIIWAFHPQYADTVAWISSVTDLLLVFFGLTSLLLYARALDSDGRRRQLCFAGSLAALLLAVGAKESGAVVVALIAGYHLLLGDPTLLRERRVPWSLAPFLVIPVIYFSIRVALVGNLATEGDTAFPSWEFVHNIHRLSGLAGGPLVGQIVSNSVYGKGQGAAGMLLIAGTIVALVIGSWRERYLAYWYYVTLPPYLVLTWLLLVGRYLYLPLVGPAILLGIAIAKVVELIPSRPDTAYVRHTVAATALAAIMVWFGVIHVRHQHWLTAKGEEAEAFIHALKETYPTLPADGRLIVTDYPPTLSLTRDDGYMLRPAIRIAYDRDVEIITLSQIDSGAVPPPNDDDVWYPPRTGTVP